jgi:hypothetical protein
MTMADNENARALTEALIPAGREPLWVVLVVGWTYGRLGRAVALDLIDRAADCP